MTRADELLAEVRGAMEDSYSRERLRSAVRELDDFMSAFGLLPRGWQVRIELHEHWVDGSRAKFEVPEATLTKLRQVIVEALEVRALNTVVLREEAATVAAQAVADAILEEHRQYEVMARYIAAGYVADDIRRKLEKPAPETWEASKEARPLAPDDAAAEAAWRRMQQRYHHVGCPSIFGTGPCNCPGVPDGPQAD